VVDWVGTGQISEISPLPLEPLYPFSLFLFDSELCVALSDLDRGLIKDCIEGDPQAWKSFCDRFAGLVMDVVDETLSFARSSSDKSRAESSDGQLKERLTLEFFQELRENGFALMRAFRGDSSLATYLAVVARRSVLSRISKSPTN
jgi:RNA polymerase sigma-70 factor (ECF subfamily)